MAVQERLDTQAAGVTAELTAKLLAPFNETLAKLEGVFPGLTERVVAAVDPAKIKAALSAEVAASIKALMEEGTEESLTTALVQVRELRALLERGADASVEEVKALVSQTGGVFVGKEELVKLGQIGADAEIPAMPEWISRSLLESVHPLRGGTIASHVIIGFDLESQQWLCIDRGTGGESDIVPGSRGLIDSEQDKLISHIAVERAGLSSPTDSCPVERVLNSAIALHMMDKKPIESLPFRSILGRTADTNRGAPGCRVLLGDSSVRSTNVRAGYLSDLANDDVGLLACWNQK